MHGKILSYHTRLCFIKENINFNTLNKNYKTFLIFADNVLKHSLRPQENTLHVMYNHKIYEICKGQHLITSLNQLGLCESYNSLQKQKKELAKYAIIYNANSEIVLPSHISNASFKVIISEDFDQLDWNT